MKHFRLFEEYSNFQYNIEYSDDQEIQPSPEEKKIVHDWSLDNAKVVSVEGNISFADHTLLFILDNGIALEFSYHYSQGPGASGDSYAEFQVVEKGIGKELVDVYDEYLETEGWQSGMLVLGVLNLYEDMMSKKQGHYTGKKYGI